MDIKNSKIFDNENLDIENLEKVSRDFFKKYGGQKLLGIQFIKDLEESPGKDLFEKLIHKCRYKNNAQGFFKDLFSSIRLKRKPVFVNDIKIPILYLHELLGFIMPSNKTYSLNTIEQLEKKAFVQVDDKAKMQKVMDLFPVRLSDHVIRQSIVSKGVANQYLPFTRELDPTGHVITFDGHLKNGVLEQMYQNRVIFLLDMHCPVYCRFCFRKHKNTRKEKTVTVEEVKEAVLYVKGQTSIKEILITGGEPVLNKPNLETAINYLIKINHVEVIRIATRSIAYFPSLFLKNNAAYIQYLTKKNNQALAHGKRIEIGVHFVHPDEVSIQCLEIISQLNKNGIQVYVQTPFLNGLNTNKKTLGKLFTLLRQANVKIYYIFAPCSPIHGTKVYWAPISRALEAVKYLRANISDRCIPKLSTATPLGKIEWHSSGWAVEKDAKDKNYTWIRTPYTLEYFKQFIIDEKKMPEFRVNNEGTLDARFLLDMGNDKLLLGPAKECSTNKECRKSKKNSRFSKDQTKKICSMVLANSTNCPPISETYSKSIFRVHKTRLEMFINADEKAFEYIKQNSDITDVVIHWKTLDFESQKKISQIILNLKKLPHIVCVRLCCKQFIKNPSLFSQNLIETISKWCDFSIGNPVKIEIETWVLLPGEIDERHKKIANKLISYGVNIYANALLIKGINDDPSIIVNLCHKLRASQIEFHNLYVSGHKFQEKFNGKLHPRDIVDIASMVRRECSGRQIPLYIIQTPTGEVDFNMVDF